MIAILIRWKYIPATTSKGEKLTVSKLLENEQS